MSIEVACIMMQKDETLLLDAWLRYHCKLFGAGNLFVIDNGSTNSLVSDILNTAEKKGVHVYRHLNQDDDYKAKGSIVAEMIRELDRTTPYDYYFPLDRDEFVACELEGEVLSCERDSILQELEKHKNNRSVLTTSCKYYNTPFQQNLYRRLGPDITTKCFFTKDACVALDHGYHLGQSILGNQQVRTKIIYFEFHHKPYFEFRRSCLQKISSLCTRLVEKNTKGLL
jgi:hypothetical protein